MAGARSQVPSCKDSGSSRAEVRKTPLQLREACRGGIAIKRKHMHTSQGHMQMCAAGTARPRYACMLGVVMPHLERLQCQAAWKAVQPHKPGGSSTERGSVCWRTKGWKPARPTAAAARTCRGCHQAAAWKASCCLLPPRHLAPSQTDSSWTAASSWLRSTAPTTWLAGCL
jgi:hypothetical protein